MEKQSRRAAVAAYKERKAPAGIYAVTCAATGGRWLGSTPDLSTVQNRLWFTLRMGSHRNTAMQAAWKAHGEESFSIEEIEALPDEDDAYLRGKLLAQRLAHWMDELKAGAVLP